MCSCWPVVPRLSPVLSMVMGSVPQGSTPTLSPVHASLNVILIYDMLWIFQFHASCWPVVPRLSPVLSMVMGSVPQGSTPTLSPVHTSITVSMTCFLVVFRLTTSVQSCMPSTTQPECVRWPLTLLVTVRLIIKIIIM